MVFGNNVLCYCDIGGDMVVCCVFKFDFVVFCILNVVGVFVF